MLLAIIIAASVVVIAIIAIYCWQKDHFDVNELNRTVAMFKDAAAFNKKYNINILPCIPIRHQNLLCLATNANNESCRQLQQRIETTIVDERNAYNQAQVQNQTNSLPRY